MVDFVAYYCIWTAQEVTSDDAGERDGEAFVQAPVGVVVE